MSKPERTTIFSADWQTLFEYEQNSTLTAVRICSRQTNFTRRVNNKDVKGSSLSRHVRFKLCGLDLSDSFEALSVALSLLKVFEHRQFVTGDKSMVMQYPTPNDPELRLFCVVQQYKEAYDGLRIDWMSTRNDARIQKEHTMHIGYVHHFRNALHRAMSWLSPLTQVESTELPAIKHGPWRTPGAQQGARKY